MMTRTFSSVAVMAALGLLAPMQLNAFGLGKLELSSALNEPFKAEIGITALKGDDANNLQVRLASSKEFEQAGIERNFLLTQLKFDVVEKSGNVKIVISSQQPIREPFIDFLLTATTTGSGRLIREYTVLLDPPKSIFNKPVVKPQLQSPAKNLAKTTVTTSASTTNYKSASFDGDSYGPVTRTDTLWDIALKTIPETNITVHQMMLALLKANPSAFQYENVNGLKAGYTLSIPSTDDIYRLTKQQAINAFAEQNNLWKNRNTRPTTEAAVTADKAITPSAEEMPSSGKTVATESTEPATDVNDTARLKLVVPNDEPSLNDDALSPLGAEKIKVLSEQLTLAQETIEGQTQENIDFKERMDALEVQMETMRRLISLKDADLARLQSMLEKDQQPDEQVLPVDAARVANDEADTKNESLESSTADISATKDELESMFITAQNLVTNNKLEVAIAAGGLLLLLVVLLIAKRRKESDEAEKWDETQNLVNNDDEDLVTVQPSNLDDVQQTVETEVIEKETVAELIEQADMLVAYADYEKAMALLEQAQQQEPTNQVVLSKMLYVLFKQQRIEPFVTLASSLNIDKTSSEWLEIATWGRELAPLNTLFQIATDDNESTSTLTLDAFSDVKDDEFLAEPIVINELDHIEENESNTIEFNLDDYASDELVSNDDSSIASLDEINENSQSLTFDTSFPQDDEDKRPAFDAPLNFEDNSDKDEDVLSLNDELVSLDLTEEAYRPELLSTDDNLHDLDVGLNLESENNDIEFDISGYDEIDEAETKLDLASAYADMGDPDGARNILEEVLKEGNAEQKAKAQTLLKGLS